MSDRFVELLDAYWAAAYQQGKDGRAHDDKDGSAQVAESNLCHFVDSLRLALSTAHAEGMEAAARIAEKFEVSYAVERDNHEQGTPEFYMNNSGSYASMDIAAAIRRAKESKT